MTYHRTCLKFSLKMLDALLMGCTLYREIKKKHSRHAKTLLRDRDKSDRVDDRIFLSPPLVEMSLDLAVGFKAFGGNYR